MHLKYKYILVILVFAIADLNSQTVEFYENKNYVLVNTGLVFNHPIQQNKAEGIKRLASNDINFSLSLFTFNNSNKRHGWQYRVGGGTQSVRFKIKDKDGYYSTRSGYSGGDGNYFLNINKTYNFNLSKKINALISFGPILLLNRQTNLSDSLKFAAYSDYIAYNINPIGFGFYTAANTAFYLTSKTKFIVSLSYQRGFIKYREARITNPSESNEVIFNYYGSGAGLMIGLLFDITRKEVKKITPK